MTDKKRRQFVTMMGASAVAIPVSAVIGTLPSHASDMVDADSAEAKNWEYVNKSAMADKMCNNCALFQGEASDDAGGCPLFPGRQVVGTGWCKAYAPKPS